jgi:hypothetical protein
MSDTEVWFRRMKPMSLFKHYNRLQAVGDKALEMEPSTEVAMQLANVAGRCATRIRHWYSPWHPIARWYNLPWQRDLLERGKKLMKLCIENDPANIEAACRLGEIHYELGEMNDARAWYKKCRDDMQADDPKDEIWQSVAHTHLCTHFEAASFNVPFG